MVNTQIDLDKEMKKFEMNLKFQIEDIQTKIDTTLVDYDKKIKNRLTFLSEQASITRKLEVAKSTIEAQTFSSQNGMMANFKINTLFIWLAMKQSRKRLN